MILLSLFLHIPSYSSNTLPLTDYPQRVLKSDCFPTYLSITVNTTFSSQISPAIFRDPTDSPSFPYPSPNTPKPHHVRPKFPSNTDSGGSPAQETSEPTCQRHSSLYIPLFELIPFLPTIVSGLFSYSVTVQRLGSLLSLSSCSQY